MSLRTFGWSLQLVFKNRKKPSEKKKGILSPCRRRAAGEEERNRDTWIVNKSQKNTEEKNQQSE